jgi:hypothetical protein
LIVYVSHAFSNDEKDIENAKKITHDLQMKDLANLYVCPLLALSHIERGEISNCDEIELRFDLLSCADRLIIASETISKDVQKEINFAELVKMEVLRFDESGTLQPFPK